MLQTIREKASGWIAYVIVGLLSIPFIFFGVNAYYGEPAPQAAAQVNGTDITLREFQQTYQSRRMQLQQMLGSAGMDLLDEDSLKREVLQDMITARAVQLAAREQGFRVGDQSLGRAVQQHPRFQVGGRFDPEVYRVVLQQSGLSPSAFEESMRVGLVNEQLESGLVKTMALPRAEADRLIALVRQEREVEYLRLDPDQYAERITVGEDEILSFYEDNREVLQSPEQVRVQYLELNPRALASQVQVSEDELRTLYREQAERFGTVEEREASQILVPVPGTAGAEGRAQARERAAALHDRLQSGEIGFDALMDEIAAAGDRSVEADRLGSISQGLMDADFDEALFAIPEVGQFTAPVETRFGYHIIRLDGVTPADLVPFEEVREELLEQARLRAVEGRFYNAAEDLYTLAFEQPDTLEPAALELGLAIQESGWFDRSGGSGIAAFPRVVSAAFSEDVLLRGENSEVIEVEPNHAVVVRLLEHRPAAPMSLEQARPRVIELLRQDRAAEAMIADAETIAEAVRNGTALFALVSRYPARHESPGLVTRGRGGLDRAVEETAFRLPPPADEDAPSVAIAQAADGAVAVVALHRVRDADPAALSEAERDQFLDALREQLGAGQLRAAVERLRDKATVVTFEGRL